MSKNNKENTLINKNDKLEIIYIKKVLIKFFKRFNNTYFDLSGYRRNIIIKFVCEIFQEYGIFLNFKYFCSYRISLNHSSSYENGQLGYRNGSSPICCYFCVNNIKYYITMNNYYVEIIKHNKYLIINKRTYITYVTDFKVDNNKYAKPTKEVMYNLLKNNKCKYKIILRILNYQMNKFKLHPNIIKNILYFYIQSNLINTNTYKNSRLK